MVKQGFDGKSVKNLLFAVMLWMLTFQNPLERVWGPFSYIDEITALIGACLGAYDVVFVRKGRPSKDQLWMGIPLLVFIAIGLTGNLIYQYQPFKCVVIDLYTNLKFFFALGTGYYLLNYLDWEEMKKTVQWNSWVITFILFALFLADRVFHLWPGQVRYGISSAVLFYEHPTYLAGALVFLLMLFMVFYDKKNLAPIVMALTMLVFTLRSKSFASAVVYVFLFVFFLVFRWKLRIWHMAIVGTGSIVAAWDKIRYYFFDLSGVSARSVVLQKSFEVMRDYFPIGTGFGTYGSAEAAKHYSPVYLQYNFNDYWEVRDIRNIENTLRLIGEDPYLTEQYLLYPETYLHGFTYLSDHFWPIIFGQSGALGTAVFLLILGVLIKRCLDVQNADLHLFAGVLFAMSYLMISSVAEPAFHNAVAVPLAMVVGMIFVKAENAKC